MNIATAFNQYVRRPADERFPSLDALVASAAADKARSIERTYNLRDLRVAPQADGLVLQSPRGTATLSHWAMGQLCSTVGAPASYVRDLPPALAAQCLTHGISELPHGQSGKLLIRTGGELPAVRSINGPGYGRAWDADIYAAVLDKIVSKDAQWTLPPAWDRNPAGAYRGDRDSFLILTNGGSIVNDPSLTGRQGGEMFRGFMLRNSEVGAATLVLDEVYFRYICGNLMLWGAVLDRSYRRRHVGVDVLRDAVREIASLAYRWAQSSPARDEAIIRSLISHEIAVTRDAVIDQLQAFGATKPQATAAYDACEQHEQVSPRTWWGAAQGLTRISQAAANQDDRYELDRLAAQVMARGARLVAA